MKMGLPGLVVVGAGGWVGLRLYMRQRFIEEFESSQGGAAIIKAQQLALLGGIDLNLPTVEELSVSAVPILATNHPQEAVDDIFIYGRNSIYWPEEYSGGPDLSLFGMSEERTEGLESLARAFLRQL